jgi:hypothetical protein
MLELCGQYPKSTMSDGLQMLYGIGPWFCWETP